MAVITQDEIQPFIKAGLTKPTNFKEMAKLSLQKRLRRGEVGFSPEQIKNFAIRGNTCSPEMKEMIFGYLKARAGELKNALKKCQ